MLKLSDVVERKFIDTIDLDEWEVETDSGWQDVSAIHKTVDYDIWEITTSSGKVLKCADTHILFDEQYNEIFAKDCLDVKLITRDGPETVVSVLKHNISEPMYDLTVDHTDHRFWTGNFLSHNSTTTCAFILWYILFNESKTVALLANKGETAREILGKIQLAYQHLPKWLQQGVVEWNKGSFELENGSRVIAAATSSDSIRGYSINLLFIDEAAFVENFDAFFTSTYPTISSGETTKVILVSTPKGLNHYYHIWSNAIAGKNGYTPIMVKWTQVPGRDEKWRQDTLASLNFDIEKFNQEYECDFVGSSSTLIAGWKLKQLEAAIPRHAHDGLTVFEQPAGNHVYACTVDVSRGKGLDYSAFSIIDVTEMPYKQVCTYRNNLITPIDFAEIVFRVVKSYNRAATLVEINDLGEQISTSLQYDFEYDNLLYTEHAGRGGKKISSGFGPNVDRGVRTTKTVKAVGCSILKLLLEQNQLIINDKHTISELATFSRKGNSYEAEPGYHDDMVMCLVLFSWLSDQEYFKDLTDINTLAMLREKSESDMDNEMIPFGFIEDGREDDVIDMTTPRGSWMFGDDRF